MKIIKIGMVFYSILLLNILPTNLFGKPICDPPVVSLGNDTVICTDGALLLDAGDFNEYHWSTGQTSRYISVTSQGKYWVDVFDICANKATDTINISKAPDFNLAIKIPLRDYFCKGEVIDLIAEVDPTAVIKNYSWSVSGGNVASVSIDTSKTITLTATDQYGCQKFRSKNVEFQYPYEKDSILLVTYDNQEDKFVAIYRRTSNKRTRSYILYTGAAVVDSVTSTGFTGLNLIIDQNTDAHQGSKIYNLQAEDSCGNRSKLSLDKAHRTSHLSVVREANDFTSLNWNRYIGFQYDYFYIYKGTTTLNGVIVDSVKTVKGIDSYKWTDATKTGEIFYYQVSVKTPFTINLDNGKKVSSGPYVHSLSNLEDNRLNATIVNDISFSDNDLLIFPNPYKSDVHIRYELKSDSNVSLKIYNPLGQLVSEIDHGQKSSGMHEISFSAKDFGAGPGMYFLKYEINGKTVRIGKLIEE